MWKQVRAFSPLKATTMKGMCLQNVRSGYGIPNKYSSATEAWNHTQQHPDRNVPSGIDVPLFYVYWATIDGVYKNWGHVNVRLASGKVWSDGDVYASIAAYEKDHKPTFVGWGESLNNVRLLQNVTPPLPKPTVIQVKLGKWNVRSTPNTSASIKGVALFLQKYDAVIQPDGWARIAFKGAPGYLHPSAFKII